MPSNKELLEADGFARRRRMAALERGAPDQDLPRRTRPVLVGVLLVVLAGAGLLVAQVLGADVTPVLTMVER